MDTSQPLVMTLPAHPTREDLTRLCDELAAAPPRQVVCEIGALASADLAAVDALARLKLAAGGAGTGSASRERDPGCGPCSSSAASPRR
ncbi:STAS domain-containing protein [Streptomyces diastatochromogenes]|nr:STAS domain-containing protein [Streptomyces diastatochromogenes]